MRSRRILRSAKALAVSVWASGLVGLLSGEASATVRQIPLDEAGEAPEPWPTAYAQRPQSLPKDFTLVGVAAGRFSPRSDRPIAVSGDPSLGVPFHPGLAFDLSAAHGFTDRWEVNAIARRGLCFASVDPSPCDRNNRWAGSGVGVGWAPLGPGAAQVRFGGGVALELAGPPTQWNLHGEVAGKLLPKRWLVLSPWVRVAYVPDVPDSWQEPPARISGGALVGLQATSHLLLWASGEGQRARERGVAGALGLSWTFTNHVEVGVAWQESWIQRSQTSAAPLVGVPGRWLSATLELLLD